MIKNMKFLDESESEARHVIEIVNLGIQLIRNRSPPTPPNGATMKKNKTEIVISINYIYVPLRIKYVSVFIGTAVPVIGAIALLQTSKHGFARGAVKSNGWLILRARKRLLAYAWTR